MTKPDQLTLKRAMEEGRLAEFAKQESQRKGNKARVNKLIRRASTAQKLPRTDD